MLPHVEEAGSPPEREGLNEVHTIVTVLFVYYLSAGHPAASDNRLSHSYLETQATLARICLPAIIRECAICREGAMSEEYGFATLRQ